MSKPAGLACCGTAACWKELKAAAAAASGLGAAGAAAKPVAGSLGLAVASKPAPKPAPKSVPAESPKFPNWRLSPETSVAAGAAT